MKASLGTANVVKIQARKPVISEIALQDPFVFLGIKAPSKGSCKESRGFPDWYDSF